MLWLYQRVFFGQVTRPENQGLKDLNAREAWQFAPLIFLIFWIGVYPKPLLSYINPQTEVVVAQVQPDYFKNAPAAHRPQIAEEKQGAPEAPPPEGQVR
jgi:NADH-quinone oxidoreductase subunit M